MKKIYYFTGTGNSMRAATRIAERLGHTEIISMRTDPSTVPATDCDVIGFVYPVYHWTMPDAAVKFVEQLDINPNAYIFVIAMPSFIVGEACEKLEKILEHKKAKLSYGEKVNSVANYMLVYPPIPFPKFTIPKTEKKLEKIAEDIANKCTRDIPRESTFTKYKRDKVMSPYKDLQKYSDYPFTISDSCVSCGICEKVCPVKNISLIEGKPTFQHKCAQCMACVSYCPQRAIGYEIKKSDIASNAKDLKKTPLVKLMGLPAKRKRYHNPYITVADIMRNRTTIDK